MAHRGVLAVLLLATAVLLTANMPVGLDSSPAHLNATEHGIFRTVTVLIPPERLRRPLLDCPHSCMIQIARLSIRREEETPG